MAFAREHWVALLAHPLWVFSSGPLGGEAVDAKGADVRKASLPKEAAVLEEMVHPRAHRVFFGALDPQKLTAAQRTLRRLPGGQSLMVEGDFRDWAEVESWAKEIAGELAEKSEPRV
jgi:menaquinone-dependent protoporphyrinogen oxidase